MDDIPILRLSEMYHIRIEANLRKATVDEAAAIVDLDIMRNARGLAVVGAVSGNALVDLAELERRKEFIGEGHRFFELKRTGKNITKSPENRAKGASDLTWDDYRVVARIPLTDAQPDGANPNLVQNPLLKAADGRIIAVDAKMVIDDNALYRKPSVAAFLS